MGLVTEAVPSEDSKVRRVKVSYRTTETGAKQEVTRAVQKLIVLVPVDEDNNCWGGVFCSINQSSLSQKNNQKETNSNRQSEL